MLVLISRAARGRRHGWRQVVRPCLLGLTLALVELTAIGLRARGADGTRLGLPF